MVVADERVRAVRAAQADDCPRSPDRHQNRIDGFERERVLGERAVVCDDGNVESEFERERAGVAEAPARDEGDRHAATAGRLDGRAVAPRQLAARVEQSPVEVEGDQANGHR